MYQKSTASGSGIKAYSYQHHGFESSQGHVCDETADRRNDGSMIKQDKIRWGQVVQLISMNYEPRRLTQRKKHIGVK